MAIGCREASRAHRCTSLDAYIAPVYHRLPPRIRAHALICFLALVLYRLLRTRLKAAGSEHSPERALRILRQIQQHRVKAGSREYSGLSRLTPEHRQLFKEIGIALPQ
jgi:transposase